MPGQELNKLGEAGEGLGRVDWEPTLLSPQMKTGTWEATERGGVPRLSDKRCGVEENFIRCPLLLSVSSLQAEWIIFSSEVGFKVIQVHHAL